MLRFTARTDMERIVSNVNKFNYGRISEQFIKKQLKNIQIHQAKTLLKKMDIDYDLDDSYREENDDGTLKARPDDNEKVLSDEKLDIF